MSQPEIGGVVADVRAGGKDRNGNIISDVYQRKEKEYAVYRTTDRVMVQFADEPQLAREQRRALAPLLPLRDEIDGLIQGWRGADESKPKSRGFFGLRDPERFKAKVECQDRRVAGALVQALEEDVTGARLWLEKIKNDMLNERVAFARFEYLLTAFATALIVLFGAWLLASLLPGERGSLVAIDRRILVFFGTSTLAAVLIAAMASGTGLTRMLGTSRRAKLLFLGAITILLTLAIWSLVAWRYPQILSEPRLLVSRTLATGFVALVLLTIVGLAFATAHEPTSPKRAALVFAIIAIPLTAMLVWPQTSLEPVTSQYETGIKMWRGFAAGAVGAFFSIALAIKGRTVLPDLLRTANMMDAVLRISIGAIGGAVLIALVVSDVVVFGLVDDTHRLFPLIAGFFAGFSERLVPDLLARASQRPAEFDAQMAASRAQREAFHEKRQEPDAKTIEKAAPAVPSNVTANDDVPDDDVEVGPAGFLLEDDELTFDEELPEAIGGTARQ